MEKKSTWKIKKVHEKDKAIAALYKIPVLDKCRYV